MTIKVCGKQHMKGTSKKTGNPYDFITIYYMGKARGVEGLASKSFNLSGAEYNYDDILVQADYHVEFDERAYPIEFSRVPASGK